MKKSFLAVLGSAVLFAACINDDESQQNIHDRELKLIEQYLQETPIPSVRMEQDGGNGIVMLWHNEMEGARSPEPFETVYVNYTGMFLDGRVFDTSVDSVGREHGITKEVFEPWEFTVGAAIDGFNFAVYNMREGEIVTVLLPSASAYGRGGSQDGAIRPNTPLRFDIELVEFAEEEETEL